MPQTKKSYKEELKKNAADSYDAYLAKSGTDVKGNYLNALASASAAKEISGIRKGGYAEALSSSGLSNSGYADYLRSQNQKAYQKEFDAAERELAEGNYKNISGYEKYLSNYEKIQSEISKNFIDSFSQGTNFDYDDAYARAVAAGLGKNFAAYAATKAVSAAINNGIERALVFAKMNSLSAAKAKQYAKELGLSEFHADKVYKEISAFNKNEKEYFASMTPEDYYKYILTQLPK